MKIFTNFKFGSTYNLVYDRNYRALPDITSGPEVRQIFKIQTVRKPDIFLTRRRTFENRKKIKIKNKKFQKKILNFFYDHLFVKCLKI